MVLQIPQAFYEILYVVIRLPVICILFVFILHVSKSVLMGSFIAGLLFILGKLLTGLCLSHNNSGSAHDAAALAVGDFRVHYSSIIFLFGAEFTQTFANKLGKKMSRKNL